MPKIRIRNGPYSGRERTLGNEPVSIGRDAEAGVQILDRSASRFHCEVFPVGGMYFARDLDSKNGTYVNDERLTDEELIREGDVIKIGTTELVFESGVAVNDDDSSERIAYHDDADMLSNTLEFRIDDLSDLADEADSERGDESRSLQILYQVGRLCSEGLIDTIAPKVLDLLIKALPSECAIIFLREKETGKLSPSVVRSASSSSSPVISRTIIRRTVSENRAFFTADAQEDERLKRKDSVIQKGVRSVICVPLAVGGQTRGVLYLSRNLTDPPFNKGDMELLSACAVHLGLAFQASERDQRQWRTLWETLSAIIRAMEGRAGMLGRGDRSARAAVAISKALKLSRASTWRLQIAAVLHHLGELCGTGAPDQALQGALAYFKEIDAFEEVLPLIVESRERLDGSGPLAVKEADLGTEARVIAAATSFSDALLKNPDTDAVKLIDQLAESGGFDDEVISRLKACHLDGTLYQAVAT